MTRSLARCFGTFVCFALGSALLLSPASAQARREGGNQRRGSSLSCSVIGPDRTCSQTGGIDYTANVFPADPNYSYTWSLSTTATGGCPGTGTTAPSFCGPTNQATVCVSPGLSPGRFVLSVVVSDGFSQTSCCLSINVITATTTTPPGAAAVCEGLTHTFCTTPGGTGPFTYSWSKNGVLIPGATDSCYTATTGTAGTIDNYCVTTTGSGTCGVPFTACTDLTALTSTTVAGLPAARRCEGATFQFCASTGGAGPFTYAWTKNGLPVPGATNACLTATAGAPGTVDGYCVTVTGACGPPVTRCGSLTANYFPTSSSLNSGSVCEGFTHTFCTTAGGTGPFTYSWTKNGTAIPGATNSCFTATSGPSGTVDNYCVDVNGTCGTATSCGTLVSSANTSTSTFEQASVCEGTSQTFCVTPGGTGPFTYSWTRNGNPIVGATDSCLLVTARPAGSVDQYCAIVSGDCGPPSTSCFALTSLAGTVLVTDLPDTSGCADEPVTLCANASGSGPFTYVWTRNGALVPGETNSCFAFDLAAGDSEVCVEVTGECGPPAVGCAVLAVSGCGGAHFTLTQGGYGNSNGQVNGMDRLGLITQLLATDMTVGVLGTLSLTFQAGAHDAQCVIDRLPTSGRAMMLPNFGDELLDTDCQTSPTPMPLVSDRFENILLGQVITLSLNIRLAAGVSSPNGCATDPSNLSGLTVCETMVSRDLLAGPDGCVGTADDVPDLGGPLVTVTIPDNVMDSLAALALPQTVGGVLELGNRALAGLSTGTASLSEVSSAVDSVNILFDEVRELLSCTNP
jgi:hypothetical protein